MAIEKCVSFENLITAVNKIRLDFAKKSDVPTIEFATDEEVAAALAEIYGGVEE